MKSNPTVPRISGRKPPQYPGDKPNTDETDPNFISWRNQAKTFVEFYSLVFLPFDDNFKLIHPHHTSILPWNDVTSWDAFWKVFNDFEDAKYFYGRAVWFIFHNMVDNLRQRKSTKQLVNKWRFRHAHFKDSAISKAHSKATPADKQNSTCENDLEALELQVAEDMIRSKFGPDEFLSSREKTKRKAANFCNQQIDSSAKLNYFKTKNK